MPTAEEIEKSWFAKKIQKAAHDKTMAAVRFEQRVRNAHENGLSLREIASAAGVSHEQVRRILSR